jgi:hypothetical protein
VVGVVGVAFGHYQYRRPIEVARFGDAPINLRSEAMKWVPSFFKKATPEEIERDIAAIALRHTPLNCVVSRSILTTPLGGDTIVQLIRRDTLLGKAVKLEKGWSQRNRETSLEYFMAVVLKAHDELMSDRPPELLKIPTPPKVV